MACVTLKRPLDFDPLEALHSPNRQPKRRRCTPIKKIERDGFEASFQNPNLPSVGVHPAAVAAGPSVFKESPLSPSEVANNLRDELKRMKRRRQIVPHHPDQTSTSPIRSAPGSPEPMESSAAAAAAAVASATSSSSNSSVMPSAKALMGTRDKPVFTLKQMTMICERMCKERTDQVRQEYDKILQQKLSEQYDAFVKFIDHQIQQRFNQSQLPSYLS